MVSSRHVVVLVCVDTPVCMFAVEAVPLEVLQNTLINWNTIISNYNSWRNCVLTLVGVEKRMRFDLLEIETCLRVCIEDLLDEVACIA